MEDGTSIKKQSLVALIVLATLTFSTIFATACLRNPSSSGLLKTIHNTNDSFAGLSDPSPINHLFFDFVSYEDELDRCEYLPEYPTDCVIMV